MGGMKHTEVVHACILEPDNCKTINRIKYSRSIALTKLYLYVQVAKKSRTEGNWTDNSI